MIGVTFCVVFRLELGVLRELGDGVCGFLLGLVRREEDDDFVGVFWFFLGVDLAATGDLLLVRDLKE